jgi:hypothetical protein
MATTPSRREPQLGPDLVRVPLRVERRDDDRALALGEGGQAPGEPIEVQQRLGRGRGRRQLAAVTLQQLAAPALAPPEVGHHLPARPQHERSQALQVADLSLAQAVPGGEDHVLDQVVGRGRVAEVAQAVEADARREAAEQLGLGLAVSGRQAEGQVGVARAFPGRDLGQGATSIAHSPMWRCNDRRGRYTSPAEEAET